MNNDGVHSHGLAVLTSAKPDLDALCSDLDSLCRAAHIVDNGGSDFAVARENIPWSRQDCAASSWLRRECRRPLLQAGGQRARLTVVELRDAWAVAIVTGRRVASRNELTGVLSSFMGEPPLSTHEAGLPEDNCVGRLCQDELLNDEDFALGIGWQSLPAGRVRSGRRLVASRVLGVDRGCSGALAAVTEVLGRYAARRTVGFALLAASRTDQLRLCSTQRPSRGEATRTVDDFTLDSLLEQSALVPIRDVTGDRSRIETCLIVVDERVADIAAADTFYEVGAFDEFAMVVHLEFDTADSVSMHLYASSVLMQQEVLEQFASDVTGHHRELAHDMGTRLHEPQALPSGLRRLEPETTSEVTVATAISRRADEAVAIVDSDVRTTYRELNQWSARIADGLCARGLGPGKRVAVSLPRSTELVATLLGIMRSGAAYVPIDTEWPEERVGYVVDDCKPDLLVSRSGISLEGLATASPADLPPIDRTVEPIDRDLSAPDSPAYVIYTSGSTGRPKGVEVPHSNIANLITAAALQFDLDPRDTWTFFHSPAFDYSVWEIWACLATGGRLVIVPYLTARSPADYWELLRSRSVTIASQTPSAFAQLVDVVSAVHLRSDLRLVILGGAPVDPAALRRWYDVVPEQSCQVVNMYGITETTVHSTVKTLSRHELARNPRSVGKPLSGWGLDVRDDEGKPVPPLVRGEICVSGAGLAAGYVNNPGQTRNRFVADTHTGIRYYRSGDLGRILLNGELEHLGRIDNQVKIRGYRVELDEIRSVLVELPTVSGAAVLTRIAATGDPHDVRLVAFCACSAQETTARELKHAVARRLPNYMVPDRIEIVETLPLTPNGKTDLEALERSLAGSNETDLYPVESSDEVAATVAQLWSELFETLVSEDSDFFELGGNSLLAVTTAKRLQERGLPKLPVYELYSAPTVSGVAVYLESVMRSGRE